MDSPLVSFGLPVYNGGLKFKYTLDSLLAQDYCNLEIVISDNASTDNTRLLAELAAQKDSRVFYHRFDRNYGQIENFNHTFRLSRGVYFRWVGCGDSVARNYARLCSKCLDSNREAVGVTSNFCFVQEDGTNRHALYSGPRLDETSRLLRLRRFLWFVDADPLYFDPIYSMLRRDALMKTQLLRIHRDPDLLLALELCFVGPFVHLDENLAQRVAPDLADKSLVAKRYHTSLITPRFRMVRRYFAFAAIAQAHSQTLRESLLSYVYVSWYGARRIRHLLRRLLCVS